MLLATFDIKLLMYADTQPSTWFPYNIEGIIAYMAMNVVIIKKKIQHQLLDANIQHGSMRRLH